MTAAFARHKVRLGHGRDAIEVQDRCDRGTTVSDVTTCGGGDWHMGVVLLVLLLALILGGLGFAVHVLWWIALIVLAIWLLGFFVRSVEGSRWYRW
jgi:hypothetical protein